MAFVEGGTTFGIPSSVTSGLNELWTKPPKDTSAKAIKKNYAVALGNTLRDLSALTFQNEFLQLAQFIEFIREEYRRVVHTAGRFVDKEPTQLTDEQYWKDKTIEEEKTI